MKRAVKNFYILKNDHQRVLYVPFKKSQHRHLKNVFKIVSIIVLVTLAGCKEIINEVDISGEQVVILAPTNNANLTTNSVTFSWQGVTDATSYHLQIAQPNFANAIQIVEDVTLEELTYSKDLTTNSYEWRIRAENSEYETNYTSASFEITTDTDFASNTVNLVSPTENLITNNTQQTFVWESISGATDYRLQVWNPDTSGALMIDETTNNINNTQTLPEGELTWQVRAQDATTNTLYSHRTVLVDTTNPNTPTLTTPTDNSSSTTNDIEFTWTRDDIAGSVESDSLYIYSDITLNTIIHKEKVSNNTYYYTLNTGTYYWFMKAFDEAGNESNASSTFQFTIN